MLSFVSPDGTRRANRPMWRRPFFSLLILVAVASQTIVPIAASTVSAISGMVTDDGGKALANVAVTAQSPSGRYGATTDARGFYSMTGVAADTYTVSFQVAGYQPQAVEGVNAFADQIAHVNVALHKSLRTIANVRSRSAGGAFQPNQTADTYTVTSTQISTIQGSPVNVSEKNLLRAMPGVSYSIGDAPTIRGGRTNNVDYEFEGMSYTDPYLNRDINNFQFPGFAVGSVQVSPGDEDASFGNSGVGTVNVVARQGTYPGQADVAAAVGGPGFFHALNLGYGFAAPNGRISDYISYTAQNDAPRYGGPYWDMAASDIGATGLIKLDNGREFTNNLLFRWGKNNRYGLQYFVDTSFHRSAGGYGEDDTNVCYATCDPGTISQFTGYAGISANQYQELLHLYPGQTQEVQYLGQTGRPLYQEIYNGNGTKLQLNWNASPSTYVYANWYTSNGDTISDCPTGPCSIFRNQGGYTAAYNVGVDSQLGSKHLLKAGISSVRLTPLNDGNFNTDPFFNVVFHPSQELYDFIRPNDPDGCPIGAGACGYLYQFFPNAGQLKLPPGGSSALIGTAGYAVFLNDSWQPNTKLKIDGGLRLDRNHNDLPPFGLLPDCTTRYVPLAFQTPDPTTGFINGKPVGPGNCPAATFTPLTKDQTDPSVLQPRIALTYSFGPDDSARASFGRTARFAHGEESDYSAPQNYAEEFSKIPPYLNPAIFTNGTPQINKGVYNNGTPYQSNDPNNYYGTHNIPTDCGFNGFFVPCTSYQEQLYWSILQGDFAFPISPLVPITYNNYDLSYAHQFTKGFMNGVAVKLTGWARRAYNLDVTESLPSTNLFGQIIVQSNGSVSYTGTKIATNAGLEQADGLEFYLTKENPIGLSGSLSATYNNVRQNILPSEADEFHGILTPSSVGNLYRVSYISPLTAALALAYKTRSGWRLQTTLFYDDGYPYGDGVLIPTNIDGKNYTVAHTNVTGGGKTQFVDPSNPGSVFNPNIAATLGTNEGTFPDGALTPQNITAEVTIEKSIGRNTLGFTVDNVFNEAYTGPTFVNGSFGNVGPYGYNNGTLYTGGAWGYNDRYQPVATGVSGPLTGIDRNCLLSPSTCSNYGSLVGNGAYIHRPNGQARSYYVYLTTRL